MRVTLAAILVLMPMSAALAFEPDMPGYDADFAAAKQCKPIDGRQVWQGKTAYYIQEWLGYKAGGPLDPDAVGVVAKNSSKALLKEFRKACAH